MPVAPDSVGPDPAARYNPRCTCGHPLADHRNVGCYFQLGSGFCRCGAFESPPAAEASRPEANRGSGAEPPFSSDGRLLAIALQARGSSVGRCACGALRADHLTERPLATIGDGSGYCILRKNARTSAIPGVLPLRQVRL